MRKLYKYIIDKMLGLSYYIVNKLELKLLKLSGKDAPESYSFYREAFQLYQIEKNYDEIDEKFQAKENLNTKDDVFIKHQSNYHYYGNMTNKKQ